MDSRKYQWTKYFNLSAGNYTLSVTDSKGCLISNTVNVVQPSSITIVSNALNSNCSAANGQASITASGGAGSFTYSWTPIGGTSNIASSLPSGIYTVTVLDANNCLAQASQTVVNNPAPLASITSVTNVSCFGGSNASASVNVVGGTGPFTYTWLPSGGSGSLATGLTSGTYTVNITASNGCTVSAVSPFISQPTQILINTFASQVSCFGDLMGQRQLLPEAAHLLIVTHGCLLQVMEQLCQIWLLVYLQF